MIRFLEANGYDISYISSVDAHRRGQLLRNHRAVHLQRPRRVLVGDAARRAWRPRATPASTSRSSAATRASGRRAGSPAPPGPRRQDRTLVSYKDTHFDSIADQDPVEWTGTWRDPRFTDASGEQAGERAHRPVVPRQLGHVRASRSRTRTASCAVAQHRRGVAASRASRSSSRPRRSATSGTRTPTTASAPRASSGSRRRRSAGSRSSPTTAAPSTHRHRHPQPHDVPRPERRARVRRRHRAVGLGPRQRELHRQRRPIATCSRRRVNLFADMGAQPAHAASAGSCAATRDDRHHARRPSTITAPPDDRRRRHAGHDHRHRDRQRRRSVAGVEISTDGGDDVAPGDGHDELDLQRGSRTATRRRRSSARATDDSGNTETPGRRRARRASTARARSGAPTSTPPDRRLRRPDRRSRSAMKFKSDASAPSPASASTSPPRNTGTHTGSLWTADGQRLAQATFTGETASGWQTVTFSTRRSRCSPDTTYVVSYHAPNGHYSATADYFWRDARARPERRRDRRQRAAARRAQHPGTTPTASSRTARRARSRPTRSAPRNYWVDVVFSPIAGARPGRPTSPPTSGGRTSAERVLDRARRPAAPPTSYRITPYIGATAQTPKTVDRLAAPDDARHDHRPHQRHDLHVPRARRSTRTAPGRCRPVERGDAAQPRRAVGAARA